jgi:hypothetical protein
MLATISEIASRQQQSVGDRHRRLQLPFLDTNGMQAPSQQANILSSVLRPASDGDGDSDGEDVCAGGGG